jgi:hypothetical protein
MTINYEITFFECGAAKTWKNIILLKKAAAKGRSKAGDSEDLAFLEKLKSKLNRSK